MMTLVQRDPQTAEKSDLAALGVVIPTFNAARGWRSLQTAIDLQGIAPEQVLIIDSSSTDDTRSLAGDAGYTVFRIPKCEFSHGGTRQLATWHLPWASVLLYITQDAIPANRQSFSNLFRAFQDAEVGVAYGRQLPREAAGAIERHARLFNYPGVPAVRCLEDRKRLGLRAAFSSNSFAAYRRRALDDIGGIPTDAIVSEDLVAAARMLLKGWKVAYCADAKVIHSHALSISREFCRYFDIGVNHARQPWIRREFGQAGGEGFRFLRSELRYLILTEPSSIPRAAFRTANKLCAFRLGLLEPHLPAALSRALSEHPDFWNETPSTLAENDQPTH